MDRPPLQTVYTRALKLARSVLLPAALLAITLACNQPSRRSAGPEFAPPSPTTLPASAHPADDAFAKRLEADPVACLREILTRSNALPQYRLTFYRRERLGGRLRPQEQIRALFRKEPFSVKFTWDDPAADYYESIYVASQNDSKLIVRERKSALPLLPPTVRKVDPAAAVEFGRALHPVTDFGLASIVRRTLAPLEDPQARPHITIRYMGLVNLDPQNTAVHHLRIERPPTPGVSYIAQDFYIDVRTRLPAGTDLYQPDGQLAASYRYADLDTGANLTDADFQLSG
jgi:hypothetical protein